jgi:hypothetical protein
MTASIAGKYGREITRGQARSSPADLLPGDDSEKLGGWDRL